VNLLLVRLRLIGDVVFTTPVIRALRRRHPRARLTYLVEEAARPVVAHNPHLDDILTIRHTRGLQRLVDDLRTGLALRHRRFDAVIDLHGGPRSALLTWASRAPVRVGYDVPGREWMYTRVFHRPRDRGPIHSVENQWDLLGVFDDALRTPPDPARDRVEMPVDPDAVEALDRRLAAWHATGGRLIVLHVSAGNPFRRWPESSFAELTAALAAAPDRFVLVTSGPSDHAAAARVVSDARQLAAHAAERIIDAEGLTLAELRAAMDRAALFIGGDSGPLHIAATSDVPVVGLYGPTLPIRSAPWRPREIPTRAVDVGDLPCRPCDQRACAPGDFRCLTGIRVARVRDAAEALLGGGR
jgi:lipopolysaccharide heptosyltransferase II